MKIGATIPAPPATLQSGAPAADAAQTPLPLAPDHFLSAPEDQIGAPGSIEGAAQIPKGISGFLPRSGSDGFLALTWPTLGRSV